MYFMLNKYKDKTDLRLDKMKIKIISYLNRCIITSDPNAI